DPLRVTLVELAQALLVLAAEDLLHPLHVHAGGLLVATLDLLDVGEGLDLARGQRARRGDLFRQRRRGGRRGLRGRLRRRRLLRERRRRGGDDERRQSREPRAPHLSPPGFGFAGCVAGAGGAASPFSSTSRTSRNSASRVFLSCA